MSSHDLENGTTAKVARWCHPSVRSGGLDAAEVRKTFGKPLSAHQASRFRVAHPHLAGKSTVQVIRHKLMECGRPGA